jgi:hypothetical protein
VSYRRIDRKFQLCLQQARIRVDAVWACVNVLCPDKPVATRRELAQAILNLSDSGKVENMHESVPRITDAAATEIIWRNSQCVMSQRGRCPLLLFGRQIADDLNRFFRDGD